MVMKHILCQFIEEGLTRFHLVPPSLAGEYIMSYLYCVNRELFVQIDLVESFLHLGLRVDLVC